MNLFYPTSLPIATDILKNFPPLLLPLRDELGGFKEPHDLIQHESIFAFLHLRLLDC